MKRNKIISVLIAAVLAIGMLTGCSGASDNKSTQNTAYGDTVATTAVGSETIEFVNYTDPNGYFTAKVPKGWTVATQDLAQDSLSADNFIIAFLCDEKGILLFTDRHYKVKVEALRTVTAESLFKDALFPTAYSNWNVLSSSTTAEQQQIAGQYLGQVLDAKTFRATFTNTSGESCEGEFAAIVKSMNNFGATNMGYDVLNLYAKCTKAGELDMWEPVLSTINSSIQFTSAFYSRISSEITNTTVNNNGTGYAGTGYTGTYDAFDQMSDSYAARNKSQDIYNEKFKDYIYGNERMQDNSTGTIYNTDPSFYDEYQQAGGERYSPITDDQYLDGTSGTLGW